MKKLRAIQERVGSGSLPNDLRGVGQSPLLTDLPPCPYLVVDGSQVSKLEAVEKLFGLQLYPQDDVLVLESALEESHKHRALRLWYAARYLLQLDATLRLQLGERDLLREALLANIGQTKFFHPDRVRREPVAVRLHGPGTLAVSSLLQHVLVQVGYPLHAGEDDLVLNANDALFGHEVLSHTPKAVAV
ncbi:MAG TPA: hypothetical protein VE954_30885 [Oligoflexus sp.]|uniref:hypothetical protein n=1 Tax=Oligoflexus sp. TaxID=1971216 RepID=UPI002D5C29A6|nr:hypothetical protein [Oligoflexus sp.]HYX37530.1 hypothetical protein [Oligoflexus sp.]